MAVYDLSERLLCFAADVIKFCRILENSIENRIIKHQLIKASTSVGANYEESQGASSRADFSNKVKISLKEIREANYWLKVIERINSRDDCREELAGLLDESEQLKKILGAICQKSNNKL